MSVHLLMIQIAKEAERSEAFYGDFNSSHEAYAVMLEELDEVWEIVRKKSDKRDYEELKKELVQVCAMGVRFIKSCCEKEGKGYGK